MYIIVNIKQLGKKRDKIKGASFYLEHTPKTVRELICESVRTCVTDYNNRVKSGEGVRPLEQEEIQDMSEIGKIAFGINYGRKTAVYEKAVETALQAFEDGIFRIFLGEEELLELEQEIALTETSMVTFVRLTMLSGRMF